MRSAQRGFTLIELLVVIAIIGILSSIVLASLNTARQKGRDARRVSDIKQLQLALELYFDSSNNYPTTLAGLAPNYISVVPTDPKTGSGYRYSALGSGTNCNSYHLGALMETDTAPGLANDSDAAVVGNCTGGGSDFHGLSAGGGVQCTQTAGTAAPGGTERCYDVKP